MYSRKFLIITILLCLPGLVYAANDLYYIPQGTVEERLKEGIGFAQYSVDICIHDFAAIDIGKNLETAKARGVKIRAVILELDNGNIMGSLSEVLIQKGFDARVLKMQSKDKPVQDFFILDNRILVTGVYNWLAYKNRNIHNDVIFSYYTNKIHNYKDIFYRLFTEGEIVPLLAYRAIQGTKIETQIPEAASSIPDKIQMIQGNLPDKEISTSKEAIKPEDGEHKDFIDISFEELDKQFSKNGTLTYSEKNELWKKYEGKYVRWRGVVSYKGMGRVDWNRVGISQKNNKSADVEILFDWRKFGKVMDIRVGRTITYTGKLVSYPRISAPYRLSDGDVE